MITLRKSKRKIKEIILHCSASREGQNQTTAQIKQYHKTHGWSDIAYNYVVELDGSVHKGRDVDMVGGHTTGHNDNSIGICYVGGCDRAGKPKDTRTEAQTAALHELVHTLLEIYPGATVHGHYEFAAKACPSFKMDAFEAEHRDWLQQHHPEIYKCNMK